MNLKDKIKRRIYQQPNTKMLDFCMVYGVLQEETWSKEPSIEGNPTEIHSKQHTFMNDESWDEYYNEETAEYN